MYAIMIMMEEKDFKEIKEIFSKSTNDLGDAGKVAKSIIKYDIINGLPNGPYYVNGTEVTMDNIDSFAYPQLAQASFDHIDMWPDLKS